MIMFKHIKTENALTGSNAEVFQGCGGGWRSKFDFIKFLQRECVSDNRELIFTLSINSEFNRVQRSLSQSTFL